MEPLRPEDPRQIGVYALLARIGVGGMGQVFLGRSPGGRAVAVKLIHAGLAQDPEFRARFRREITAARAVTGAFTASVIDADPDAPWPWLVTAFLPGMPLDEAVSRYGPLPVPAGYALGAGLAEALVSIHRAGVVHRDLKPANIMLTPDGPRVIDFGIARAADTGTITQTGMTVGSPAYMAPEQATTGDTGPPGDVFSLGAVLAYLLTGTAPFGQGSVPQLIYRIVHEPPQLAGVPDPDLRALLAGCLDKDPARRPTAALLLDRLTSGRPVPQGIGWLPPHVASAIAQRAALPLPQAAPPTVPASAPARRGPTRRGVLTGGAATAAVLGVAAIAAFRYANRPPPLALWTFEVPDYLSAGPLMAGGNVLAVGDQTIALDPRTGKVRWRSDIKLGRTAQPVAMDGRCFVYDGSGLNGIDAATGRHLWNEQIKTFAFEETPAAANGVVCMSASISVGGNVLLALDAATGARRWQYEAENTLETNAAASGGLFYIGSGDKLLYAIDAATGSLRWQAPTDERVASTPVVAGGLVIITTQGYEVLAFDAATGKARWKSPSLSKAANEGAMPVVAGSTVYVGAGDGTLHALDAGNGRERWRLAAEATNGSGSDPGYLTPIVAGGVAVLFDGNRTLYALDPANGNVRWRHDIVGHSGERPVAMGGVVYFAGVEGVVGLDLPTGRVRYRLDRSDLPSKLSVSASGLVAADGILYCAIGSSTVYAIRP
jgi:outer membrane protein assembly factor BamB